MYRMSISALEGASALKREAFNREPALNPDEVWVEIKAIGCNFFDTLIVEGKYQVRPELPFAPGAEAAGVVLKVGSDVSNVKSGDRVSVFVDYGAYATHLKVSAARVFPIPQEMPFDDAAALGLVYQTAYVGLVDRAQLTSGEWLLVHAAAGGVGLAAVQLGRCLGAKVIGTAGSPEKRELIKQHGALHAIDYRDPKWVEEVLNLSEGGANVIFDPVGGPTFDRSLKCIAFGGRLLVIGFASGTIPSAPMNRVLLKNIALVGLHWGAYFKRDPKVLYTAQEELMKLYTKGEIKPLISARYPLVEATQALQDLAARKTTGKVVLLP